MSDHEHEVSRMVSEGGPAGETDEPKRPEIRHWAELETTGLLALINATVCHPRGYALTFIYDDNEALVGWSLQGNGKEPWTHIDWQDDFDAVNGFLSGNHGFYNPLFDE